MIARFLSATAATFLLSGCAALSQIEDENAPSGGIGNAIVVEEEHLQNGRGGMLTILQMHVRGMSVSRENACPHIVLRASAARSRATEPLVYIDGQRTGDTCVLDGIDVESVARAEVYPGGVTQRPGYSSNNGGLILLFLKNGSEAHVWR